MLLEIARRDRPRNSQGVSVEAGDRVGEVVRVYEVVLNDFALEVVALAINKNIVCIIND